MYNIDRLRRESYLIWAEDAARPGLWLTGEVVNEAVTNWDWVNEYSDAFAENATELETRTWYGIPHSVTALLVPRGDELYLQSSAQTFRLNQEFPNGKAWWKNVERDPRVRLKIGGKIYEMTVVLVQDRNEVARLRGGRSPIVTETDADGNVVEDNAGGLAVESLQKAISQCSKPNSALM